MQLLNTETISRTNKRTIGSLFCELRGLREDLRFLRMLSISQGRRIDDIMEQFEPKAGLVIRPWSFKSRGWAPRKQAELTKEALIADKRAFVFAVGFRGLWEPSPTGQYNWRFRPIWQNSGDTPTKDAPQFQRAAKLTI